MVRASSPMPVSDGRDEVSSLRKQLHHQQQAHKELQTMLRNQALAIETFQSKWQMAGQEAHAFIARTRSQSEDFVRAELTAVQRFETSLQRQYDGQLKSHVNALQDECREHVGQEEDKMRKELQHALTQESSVCHDELQQALRHHVSQEEYADAAAHQEMAQLRQLTSQQAETMKRFESQSQQYVTQQHDEWTQKQHAQFQKFDGVIRDKDEVIQSLRQELANNKERHLQELDQALQDAQRRAQQAMPVFEGTSTQPYATPADKKTHVAVAAVAHAEPVPAFHSPGLSLGASAGNMNLKSKNKGSSTMVVPVRRRLRTKTSPAAAQRVPSMGVVRRRMRSKGPPPPAYAQLPVPPSSGGVPGADHSGGGPPPHDPGPPASDDRQALPPGLPLRPGHDPPDDGGDGDDSGGDSDEDGDGTPVTDLDLQEKRPRKPPGDPDSSGDDGGRGRRGRHQTSDHDQQVGQAAT